MLPGWYRAGFPAGGLELFYPGLLARTPIDAVPLPFRPDRVSELAGRVPRDLEWKGIVDPADNPDPAFYSGIRFRLDRHGFTNADEMARADLLLVGDSFAGAAGVLTPAGLQVGLQKRLGRSVFNLGIPSIGPAQEEWLLTQVGLPLEPQGVFWLFFGGNDLADTESLEALKKKGVDSYDELFAEFTWPRSFLFDLAKKSLIRPPAAKEKAHLPGFVFRTHEGKTWPLWFHPSYLRGLTRDPASVRESPGWTATRRIFMRVSRKLTKRRIRLLVVYVPSKAQVYLPYVAKDAELAFELANRGRRVQGPPEAFWQRAMSNKDNLEELLGRFCRRRGLEFLSLTPVLRELAQNGQLGYLSADTHWNEHGQRAAIEPLASWWEQGR